MALFDEIMASRGENPQQSGSVFNEVMNDRKQQQPLGASKRSVGAEVDELPGLPPSTGTSGGGAVAGSILAEGVVAAIPGIPKNMATIEGGASAGAFVGDILESVGRQSYAGQIPKIGEKELASAGTEAAAALAGGLGVRALFKGFQLTGQHFRDSVTPAAREAIDFLKQYRPDTQFFTAAELTESRVLDLAQNGAEHSLWGGGDIRKFVLNKEAVLKEMSKDIADQIGPFVDNINLGKLITKIRKDGKLADSGPVSNQYKVIQQEADKIPAGNLVGELKKWAKPHAEENKAIKGFGQSLTGKATAEKIMKFEDDMSMGNLLALQRNVKAKVRSLQKSIDKSESPAIKFYGDLDTELDGIIEKGLRKKGVNPDLWLLKKDADTNWAAYRDKFSNEVIKDLMKKVSKNPAGISKHIVIAEHEGAEQLIVGLNRINPPHVRQMYQRGALEIIYKGASDASGNISGESMMKFLVGENGMGERAGKALWGKEGYNTLFHFAKSLTETQKKAPISEGKLAIQFVQFGALMTLPYAAATGNLGSVEGVSAATILIAPKVLAKMLTSPKVEQALLRGASMPRSDPRWPATLARITSVASVGQMQKDKEEQDLSLKDILKGDPAMNPLLQGAF